MRTQVEFRERCLRRKEASLDLLGDGKWWTLPRDEGRTSIAITLVGYPPTVPV